MSHNLPHPGRIACSPAPKSRPPATKALHTICGNNTSIVSSSWWWTYKCPKHLGQIISAIKHSIASSWFYSLRLWIKDVYLHACTERNAHYEDLCHLLQTSGSWRSVPKDTFSHSGTGAQNGNETQHRVVSRQLSLNQIENAVTTLSDGPSHITSLSVTSRCVRSHTYKYNLIFCQHKHSQYQLSALATL